MNETERRAKIDNAFLHSMVFWAISDIAELKGNHILATVWVIAQLLSFAVMSYHMYHLYVIDSPPSKTL